MNSKQITKNQNFKTDLIALSHPLMLLSILILLINDHILKVYAPSALTGKLSDFAGLFFFPILLSAVINFVFRPLNPQPRHIAFAVFGFTAIWFTLIKTIPIFTNLTESLLSVQIICDPGDLMALVMLLPAWKLRTSIENESKTGVRKISYVALGIASIATLATSPSYNPAIYQLVVHKNLVYTNIDYNEYYFYSADGGKSWLEVENQPPTQVSDQLSEYPPELPVTLCLPNTPTICYQTGEEIILESADGGATWSTSWSIPENRKEFLEKNSPFRDLGPYDLVFLDYEGRDVILAALGTGGVLVKTEDDAWENYAVSGVEPLVSKSRNLNEAIDIVLNEIIILSGFAILLLIFIVLANVVDRESLVYSLLKTASKISIISFPFIFIFLSLGFELGNVISFIVGTLFLLSTFATLCLILLQILTNTTRHGLLGFFLLLLTWFTSCTIFIAWAYGIIPAYGASLVIVIIVNIITVIWILHRQMNLEIKQTEIDTNEQ